MKNLAFLEHVDHDRKAAIYAAQHDGKLRNFAYHQELGKCRETFVRLVQDVQQGAIGVILTPDATCLSIETSPGWMEAFIRAVKQHDILIGDHSHDLVYDLREEEDETQFRALYPQGEYEQARSAPRPLLAAIAQSPFAAAYLERRENWFLLTRLEGEDPRTAIYSLSSGAIGKDVDLFGLGRWKEMLDTLALYGITEQEGWCPVSQERRDWLVRTQRQEDAMAEQTTAAMKPHRGSLPTGAHVRVILPGNGKARGKRRRKRGGERRERAVLSRARSVSVDKGVPGPRGCSHRGPRPPRSLDRRRRPAGGRAGRGGRDRFLPHGFKDHGTAAPHLHLFFRPSPLQTQSRALPQVERLLPAPVPRCGAGLEAAAGARGHLPGRFYPAARRPCQGRRGDPKAAGK